MKKISTIVVIAVMFVFASCQKENVAIEDLKATEAYKVEVVDDMLYFKTEDDYQNTIDYLAQIGDDNFEKWEKEVSFNSMRAKFDEEALDKMGIEDNLLATLLNPTGIIRIGENVFKLDIPNEMVYSTPASKYTPDFYTEKGVKTFSIDDDVLEIIAGSYTGAEKGKCKKNKEDGTWTTPTNFPTVEYKIVYQRAGVYFSLQAKIKKINQWNGDPFVGLATAGTNNRWKKKGASHYVDIVPFLQEGYKHEYNYRPYGGGKRLVSYKFEMDYWANIDDGYTFWANSDNFKIRCNHN